VLPGRPIDVVPRAAAGHLHGAGLGVDRHRAHRRQIHDEGVVPDAEPARAVAAPTDGQVDPVLGGEADARGHIARTLAKSQRGGPAIDHCVVDGSGLVVPGVLGGHERPFQAC